MFTIRHYDDDGHDTLTATRHTQYMAEERVLLALGCPEKDGQEHDVRFDSGHCFVMNDAGKTVAAYNFRPNRGARYERR